jgi:hypothetical protein
MEDSLLLHQLNALLLSRNPFYEAMDDVENIEGVTDNPESQAGDSEELSPEEHQ